MNSPELGQLVQDLVAGFETLLADLRNQQEKLKEWHSNIPKTENEVRLG